MSTRSCTHCGHPLPEQAKFCGQCGALTAAPALAPVPAAPAPRPLDPLKSTMLGFGAAAPNPTAPASSAPTPAGAGSVPNLGQTVVMPQATPQVQASRAPLPNKALSRTMLGLAPGAAAAVPPQTMAAPTQTMAATPQTMAAPMPGPTPKMVGSRTMLGVAIPGIAPLRPGEATLNSAELPPPEPRGEPLLRAPEAPLRGAEAPLPEIIPAPAPLAHIPAPPPPRIVRKKGVPLVGVAVAAALLLVAGGVAIALFWHGPPPITALARVTPEGKDVLHLHCDPASCADGTVAQIDGASATFASGSADLPLAQPLHVGSNPLSLKVDRPGMGRDEVVKLDVPVAYRVWADVAPMNGPRPSILIHVQAVAGSDVRVADKPVTLDAAPGAVGSGTYSIDETAATEGAADESRVVAMDVPYAVATGGKAPETGTVSARVSVAPLRVDAPGARTVVEVDHVVVAGRAAKGSTVTIDGAPAAVAADGAFEGTVAIPAPGEVSIEVKSGTTTLAPRTVHVSAKRVTSLVAEGKAFEKRAKLGYDAALADLAGTTGQPIVVEGEVMEPRASGRRTLLLVDDRRGCAKGPCLARVVVGQTLTIARGDRVRAYGRVARGFATPSGMVPEIEADFVVPSTK